MAIARGVTAGTLYKFLDILGTGIGGVSSRDVDIVLDAGQGANSASTTTPWSWAYSTTFLDTAIFSSNEREEPSIITEVKPAVNTGLTGFKIRAVIQMECRMGSSGFSMIAGSTSLTR